MLCDRQHNAIGVCHGCCIQLHDSLQPQRSLVVFLVSTQHKAQLARSLSICRFKSRAHAVEVAAAKARTHYAPEGPSVEEEEASGQDAAPHAFKKQRTSKSRHNQEYWDCYFHRNACFAKASRPQPVHHTGTDSEEEDEEDQGAFSSWDEGSDFEGGCFDLDSDEEAEEEYAGQQHPQSFYKQPTCLMSVPAAFQQLVDFVKQLPSRVKDDKAAAHLKTFEARKVQANICTASEYSIYSIYMYLVYTAPLHRMAT